MTNTDKAPSQDVLSALAAIVGPKGVVAGDDRAPHLAEWRDKYKGETPLILAPASTEEVSRIVALCAEHGLAVTPQGGNTGLVGGQIPYKNEILVTLKRMIRIRGLAADGMSLAVDAGVTVEAAQGAAAEADRLFPLSLSSEGTAQIGGVVSTNAGGVNVLRYGNMRELVLGLEAVLPDGRIWNGMRALRKDNTGYDLKQLFIGAEGTLGLVTGAVLKLVPRPEDRAVAFVGLAAPAAALSLLARTQSASGGLVTSFELIPRIGIELDEKNIPGCRDPLSAPFPWYALIELAAGRGAGLRGVLEALLAEALDDGVIADAAIVENETQAEDFWRLRHSLSASMKPEGGCIKHDVSVPVEKVPAFLAAADAAVTAAFPGARIVAFGHLGDGNIHYDVCRPLDAETEAFLARWEEMQRIVHDIVAGFDGSISAEHGLGRMKRDEITRYKSQVELDMMRAVKAAFDPQGLMNPGKVL